MTACLEAEAKPHASANGDFATNKLKFGRPCARGGVGSELPYELTNHRREPQEAYLRAKVTEAWDSLLHCNNPAIPPL